MSLNPCVMALLKPDVLQAACDSPPHLFGFEPAGQLVHREEGLVGPLADGELARLLVLSNAADDSFERHSAACEGLPHAS